MILNILDNAAKYVQSGGNVKICADIAGEDFNQTARIFIEDNGTGIPDELKKLYLPDFTGSTRLASVPLMAAD